MKRFFFPFFYMIAVMIVTQSCTTGPDQAKSLNDSIPVDTVTVQDTISTSGDLIYLQSIQVEKSDMSALKSLSRSQTDEFSENVYYMAKSTTEFVNRNSIHCYIVSQGDYSSLRFKVQYYAEDWLFIDRATFNIDGVNYNYTFSDVSRDNGDGSIWEWADVMAGEDELKILTALANAKKAKVKFYGSEYHMIKAIPQSQLKAIKQTLRLYKSILLNGQ